MENPVEKIPFVVTFRKILLRCAMLTAALIGSLTLITFWGSKTGYDFNILRQILIKPFGAYLFCTFLQVHLAMGKQFKMMCGCFGSILYCGYTVYATDELIKGHENIWAASWLFIYIVGLFFALVNIFIAVES